MHQFGVPNLVPRILKPLCKGTSAAAPGTKNSYKPKKYCPPIDGGELIDTSGLADFRKTLLYEGISENASHNASPDEKAHFLIMSQPGENGLAGVLNKKLILLTFLFNYGNKCSTIYWPKSSISAFREHIDGYL